MDLFIDPINPFGKKVSSTLQSTLDKQKEKLEKIKQERAEKRAQEKISYSDLCCTFLSVFKSLFFV